MLIHVILLGGSRNINIKEIGKNWRSSSSLMAWTLLPHFQSSSQ